MKLGSLISFTFGFSLAVLFLWQPFYSLLLATDQELATALFGAVNPALWDSSAFVNGVWMQLGLHSHFSNVMESQFVLGTCFGLLTMLAGWLTKRNNLALFGLGFTLGVGAIALWAYSYANLAT